MLAELARDPVDGMVCLGDALQGGPQPAEVLDRLVGLDCPVVLGNADAFLLDPEAGEVAPTEEHLDVRTWTNERLGPERLERIREFQPTVEVDLGRGHRLLGFHGSPSSYDEILVPTQPYDEFRAALGELRTSVLAGGHVHQQYHRRVEGSLMVNPGSIGQSWAWDDPGVFDPWAAYAVITTGDGGVEVAFRRVTLDVDEVLASIERSGRPHPKQFVDGWRRIRS